MIKPKRIKKPKQHYVSNKDFLVAMIAFKEAVAESEQLNKARPRVPTYIGECLMKISTHLSYKPNFINYSFKEEMISDGIENCLQYIDNFDPEKSSNPFAYFTQIIYFAFLRRIAKEKKYTYIKHKLSEEMDIMNLTSDNQAHDTTDYTPATKTSEWTRDHVGQFIEDFEESKRKKKRNKKTTPIDVLINDAEVL